MSVADVSVDGTMEPRDNLPKDDVYGKYGMDCTQRCLNMFGFVWYALLIIGSMVLTLMESKTMELLSRDSRNCRR